MKRAMTAIPLEMWVMLYFVAYLPNVILTRLATTTVNPTLGRPLTGLETLPASLIMNMVLTYALIWLSGWHRDAHAVQLGSIRLPVPTRYTLLSGVGTSLVLFTVPLSFTFKGVSIPFIQLLMRGDILVIAPLVDLMFGRRVRWWSWTALATVLLALLITLNDRGGLGLPSLALLTVVPYTLGYFIRLAVMTKIAKSGDDASVRRYFVEEKMVALPMSVMVLGLISASGIGGQAGELAWGFLGVWTDPVLWRLFWIAATLTVISVIAIVILLDPRENAYCVPLERAASLIAGVGASVLLAWFAGQHMPRPADLVGAAILIAAIALLSLAPRLSATALAQTASEAPATADTKADDASAIVVTGSRIRGIAPVGSNVIAIGQDKIASEPVTSTNDLLRRVPQVVSLGANRQGGSAQNGAANSTRAAGATCASPTAIRARSPSAAALMPSPPAG